MASSIPSAHAQLVALLQALTGTGQSLEGVHVASVGIWKEVKERDTIIVGDETDIDREWPGVGATRFKESYTLPIHIQSIMSGDQLTAVRTRLWALVTVVEQTVITNHQLGGLLIYMLPKGVAEGVSSGPSVDTNDVTARLTLNVECLATVQLSA